MMDSTRPGHSKFVFCALVFGLFGWVLLQVSLTRADAAFRAHAVVALVGFTLVAIAFRRCRLHRIEFDKEPTAQKYSFLARLLNKSNAGWGTLLLLVGVILGQLVLWGWVTPLFAFAIGVTCVPWSRIPLCRRHFVASIALIATGAGLAMLITGSALSSFHLAFSALALWVACLYAFLLGR